VNPVLRVNYIRHFLQGRKIVQVAPATPVLRGFDDALGKQCYIQARPQETSYPFILASQHQTLRGVPV